ncbi:MAG TPA: thiamine phosphate synthase [Chitinophagales bacterium]|nr:thiamine phosphate synthase [Chitinophagales bacterium]HQO31489.1 thiamine phosphate synthase [Chitinophagales bacterium]HQO89580.1 thiamine phosphate synthase [Chitinophagales bacterium]
MKICVYTPEQELENEISLLSAMMEEGADYLYIRKPEMDDFSLVDYMEKFDPKYYSKIITSSLIITKEFDLAGYHFTRDIIQRNTLYNDKVLDWLHQHHKISSVTAHDTRDILQYGGRFKHILVAPLFRSISKINHEKNWDMQSLADLIGNSASFSSFIAQGGIDTSRISNVQSMGFNGIALLGALWQSPEDALKKMEEICLLCKV